MSDRGRRIWEWANVRWDEGLTVYFQTHLRTIEVAPKRRHLVRLRGTHCEVARGRHWDSVNYTKVTAR